MLWDLLTKLDNFVFCSSRGNASIKMGKFGLGLCINIIALDVCYLRKLTLLNLEF